MRKAMLLLLFMAFSVAKAESVILVSGVNYPDALIADVVANRIGAEVLIVEPDEIPNETLAEIQNLTPTDIYIFGGPVVISEDVEAQLNTTYNVTRIFGITRVGTAAEVALFFWQDGSVRAVLVVDKVGAPEGGDPDLVAQAKELAKAEDIPVFIIPSDQLPDVVSEVLQQLGVNNVTVIGNVQSGVLGELSNLGISYEQITGEAREIKEEVEKRVERKIKERWGENVPLVIIAVGNWTDHVKAPAVPRGRVILVWSADEIDSVVQKVKNATYSRLFVLGKPDLARQIADALEAEGIEVDHVTGIPARIAREIQRRFRQHLKEAEGNWTIRLQQVKQRIRERWDRIVDRCNLTIHQFRALERAGIPVPRAEISETIQAYREGKYWEAFKRCEKLIHLKRRIEWKFRHLLTRDLVNEEVRKSTEDIPSSIQQLQALPTRSEACRTAIEAAQRLLSQGRIFLARQALKAAEELCR
ncbi:hypothetical protein DRN62_02130 [Nanoarchaeota archaeon]|nr:MAG: hypothetical protein DRN62_02130 [Nanoarchaeota archaeon]